MKMLWTIGKQAIKYKWLYVIAILATFLLTGINLAAPRLMSNLITVVENGGSAETLNNILNLTIILIALYLGRILFRFLSNYLAHKAAWNLVEDMRVKVYHKMQSLSMSFFHEKQTGDLMSRVVNDTATFELLYAHMIPEMVTNLVTVIGVMTILLLTNPYLALLTCIPIPFIAIAGWFFAKKVRPKFRITQRSLADLNSKLQDNFSGIQEIQAFGQQNYEVQAVGSKAGIFTKAMLYGLKLSAVFHPVVEFMSSAGTIIVVGVGGLLAYQGVMSVADVVAFFLYLALFYTPISGLARIVEETQQALAGAERVMEILDTPPEIADTPGAVEAKNIKGSITFDNVSFEYEEGIPIISDISFSCEPGQMVALVGPTGVGKTTMTQLLSRFYDPQQGKILVDGMEIKNITIDSLRSNIAPVLQDTFLFNGTIEQNISYANPAADENEIIAAAKAARIHDDIIAMPEGYKTAVGERGVRLSGGQKQRIAIARAILRKAPIVILDEATASVDAETEREIQRAINEIAGTRTIIAIAHRLSTIKNADLILVLDEGRVVQRGTHHELMEEDGLYSRLNHAQNLV